MNVVRMLGLPLITALTLPICAQAMEKKNYLGLVYSNATMEAEANFALPMVMIQAGGKFGDYFQLETRFAYSRGDDSQEYARGAYTDVHTVEVTQYIALLGKIHLPVASRLSVYGLAGLNQVQLEETVREKGHAIYRFEKRKDTEATYGVGAWLGITDKLSLNVEYQSMTDDISSRNVGLTYRMKF